MLLKLGGSILICAVCFGQSSIRQYLSLTDAQVAAIAKLNQDYNNDWFSRQNRVVDLTKQISDLVAMPAPDPQEVGSRAVELETIHRDLIATQNTLRTQVAGQLTAAQTALLPGLAMAAEIQPIAGDAGCAYLVRSRQYSHWFSTSSFVFDPVVGNIIPGIFLTPYPTSHGAFCGSEIFPISVREYLALTDPQVAAIVSASDTYNDQLTR